MRRAHALRRPPGWHIVSPPRTFAEFSTCRGLHKDPTPKADMRQTQRPLVLAPAKPSTFLRGGRGERAPPYPPRLAPFSAPCARPGRYTQTRKTPRSRTQDPAGRQGTEERCRLQRKFWAAAPRGARRRPEAQRGPPRPAPRAAPRLPLAVPQSPPPRRPRAPPADVTARGAGPLL